jgi:Spy/CpxP family protein refolding chaperone
MSMDSVSRNKWQVRVAALVIFLLGAAAGVLAPRAYYGWLRGGGPPSRQDRFEQMADRLKLSAEQRTEVQQIFGDTREQLEARRRESEPRIREIQQQADERLQRVLTPEQWQQFQQMKNEMRGRRGRGRRGGPGGGPPPPPGER